ncbi:MAG: peptidoglycan-binding protein [Pyrinomonadaceae bacterium]
MPKQKVGTGETTSSLAKKNGFFWKTIWDHPENAELKAKRQDPNVLFEDDEIFIPEKQSKKVSKGTEQEHVFKLKGEPAKFKVQLLKLGQPRANEEYVFELDNQLIDGKTDGDGKIEHFIPPDASSGRLIMKNGREVYPLRLGYLDPLDLISGVQQRLNNLGYSCGGEMGELGEQTKEALKSFQADNKLETTGEPDAATKAKLKKLSK